ncbi:MAG TPA: LLM class flavin-dependent oxidoreductase, partial [Blastocatellia bacterium]|nr:LLM class flavin-dependent oxidoreductase [Blastocatellia bacterium]
GEVQFEELRAVEELSEELSNDGARMALSLFWSGGTSAGGNRGLDLLVEAAKFADQNGFQALWLSQDGFSGSSVLAGCSVMAAAVAVLTRRIEIIGRVSFPLASSVRIAEEWSVVDNLSHGRAGVWYAGMVLAAEVPADAEIVQRLWRGETVDFTGVSDKAVPVKTLPRPVKARLPVWVFARDDEGARVAGELEAGLLIDLTMTPIENLSGLIQHYKQAFPARNWSGSSRVVAVAPVYASEDETKCARAISMARKLQCEEGRIILGTPDQCIAKIVELKALGVDEIACRIDFGLDHESILSGFAGLKRIADWSRRVPSAAPALDGVRERARSRREMTRRRHRL